MADAFWHGGFAFLDESSTHEFYAPYRVDDMTFLIGHKSPRWICFTPKTFTDKKISTAKVEIYDEDGDQIGLIDKFTTKYAPSYLFLSQLKKIEKVSDWFYQWQWVELVYQETKSEEKQEQVEPNDEGTVSSADIKQGDNDKRYLVIAENQALLVQFGSAQALSENMISVCHGSEFKNKNDTSYELNLSNKTHFEQLFDSLVNEQITDVMRLYSSDKEENTKAQYSQDNAVSTLLYDSVAIDNLAASHARRRINLSLLNYG